MSRIASEGPRFADVVLEHAERIFDPRNDATGENDQALGEAYNYIPFTVLGDYRWGELLMMQCRAAKCVQVSCQKCVHDPS